MIYDKTYSPISQIIFVQNKFNLDVLYRDFPHYKSIVGSNGNEKRLTTSIFNQLDLFSITKQNKDIEIIGLINNKRFSRYLPEKYLLPHNNLKKYKVIVPKSNGTGAFGEVLSTPLICKPLVGYTQSFIGIGAFESEEEAKACKKYICSKFARVMLGILKITQDNPPEKWKYVPLQDFSSNSDIDWNVSIPNIDRQLYKKYGLSAEEIEFIETHVKEME